MMDAVEDILKIALKKGVDVLFVKNNALTEHGNIALITKP